MSLGVLEVFARPKVLLGSFVVTLLLSVVFVVVMQVFDFVIIDEMFREHVIREHIASMSDEQKRMHIWLTATVDVLYPLAYGALFVGVQIRVLGMKRRVFAALSMVAVPVDLIEGLAQVMLLSGHSSWMPVKLMATPIKLLSFTFGLLVTLGCAAWVLLSWIRTRRA